MKSLLIAAVFTSIVTGSVAAQASQAGKSDARHVTIAMPDNIKWGPAPAVLPAGAMAAILEGNPGEAGPFTLRLALPPGYRIAPHYHSVPEHVTVISGAFYVGMGETFDAAKTTKLPAGTFGVIDPEMRHFAMTKGRTVIQLHGVGPWSLVYVNPADDPRTKTK
jgi:quercetin dioxygenase-like cupin family protein